MRYYFILTRIALTKKSLIIIIHIEKDMEKMFIDYYVNIKWCSHFGKQHENFSNNPVMLPQLLSTKDKKNMSTKLYIHINIIHDNQK